MIALLMTMVAAAPTSAHGLKPSALKLRTMDGGRIAVTWKVPLTDDRKRQLRPQLPRGCRQIAPEVETLSRDVRTTHFEVDCGEAGLTSGAFAVDGLAQTGTDVLVFVDSEASVLTAMKPSIDLTEPSRSSVNYLKIGVEHILLGLDHLLFVLGLLLLIRGRWTLLLATITAFTLAHSTTLALTVLDIVRVPPRAVEVLIALSVLLLAVELARKKRDTLAWRRPWVFAVACGLLHGLGFAGALQEVGLPPGQILEPLVFFNIGVEVGQLASITAAAALSFLAIRLAPDRADSLERALVYVGGSIAAWWVIDRASVIIMG